MWWRNWCKSLRYNEIEVKLIEIKYFNQNTFQVSETMAQSNGFISSSCEDDDKPMLLMKKSLDNQGAHGLTALINKQLQGKLPQKSL